MVFKNVDDESLGDVEENEEATTHSPAAPSTPPALPSQPAPSSIPLVKAVSPPPPPPPKPQQAPNKVVKKPRKAKPKDYDPEFEVKPHKYVSQILNN